MRWLLLFLMLTLPAQAQSNDWLIVPGQRVGPITAKTTRAQLAKWFPGQVKDDKVYLVEGTYGPATFLYPKDARKRIAVVWTDDKRQKIDMILLDGTVSEWRTSEGITLGTRLKKLEQMNGKSFKFSGLGWDLGGFVSDWQGGSLARVQQKLKVHLEIDSAALTEKEIGQISGDQPVQSGNAVAQKANPWVDRMLVYL